MADGPLPEIGTKWRHITAPGVYVVTDATTDGRVIWTEKDASENSEWVAPVREFLSVFAPITQGAEYANE